MVKNLKRTLALMLSIIMIFSSTLTAFADDEAIVASNETETSTQVEETVAQEEETSTEAPKAEAVTEAKEEVTEAATEAKKEETTEAKKEEATETEKTEAPKADDATLDDVAVYVGEDAVFTVKTDGQVKSVQWKMSKDNGNRWSNLSKKQYGSSKSLTIKGEQKYSGRMYLAEVTFKNGAKATTNAAMLTVGEIPTYPAVTFDPDPVDGISVHVDAPEGALPKGTKIKLTKVNLDSVQDVVDTTKGVDGKVVAAIDITFYDANGKEIEPNSAVKVEMTSKEIEKVEEPTVVHVDTKAEKIEEADVKAEEVEAVTVEDTVKFDSDKFSIYAVIDGETGAEARAAVEFYGKDTSDPIVTYYVKNSDSAAELVKIITDPGVGNLERNELFRGWYIGETDDYDDKVTPLDIQGVRDYLEDLSITEGDVVKVFGMIYKKFDITYIGETEGVSLGTDTVVVRTNVTSAPYTVKMAYTPSSGKNFEGWLVSEGGSNIADYTEGKTYKNNTEITISGDVVFSVNAPSGHWLVFHEDGGTYVAPQFIKDEETTSRPTIDMKKLGYEFDDWYADAACTQKFNFGGTLSDKTDVYAKWIPNTTANYVVIIWKQNVNDAKNAADSAKKYDFAESVTLNGNVGSTVDTVSATGTGDGRYAIVNGVQKRYTGFHLRTYDSDVEIDTRGNSIVNVYYDRNLVTLTFRYRQYGSWQTQTTMTGLYGSSITGNGYTWPTNRWWYDDYSSWGGQYYGDGTRTTFLDAFIISDGSSSQTYYGFEGSGNIHIQFYKQDPDDGSWPALTDPDNDVTSTGGTFHISDKYNGYKAVSYSTNGTSWTTLGEKDSQGYYADVPANSYSVLYIRYAPITYNIQYTDGVYVDGDDVKISAETSQGQWHVVNNIIYESDLTTYNKGGENYYDPTTDSDESVKSRIKEGFVFEGWYIDDQCTHPFTFTTMPEGITVYAKWRQVEYRVFLHPNVPSSDTTLNWGSSTQKMTFRVGYGEKISEPTGTRTEFEFIDWYTDEACTQLFNGDDTVLNETTVTANYNKATDLTDPMDKYGNGATTNADVDRYWITKKFDLYAKWRAKIPGAKGIGVVYDANGGTNPPRDTTKYLDQSGAIAQAASTAPADQKFLYWVVQRWDGTAYVDTDVKVHPADNFTVLKANAKEEDITDGTQTAEVYKTYTVQLRAEYGPAESPKDTFFNFYRNWTSADTAETGILHKEEGLAINEAVDIYTLTEGIPTRPGFTFLGWARAAEKDSESATPTAYHEVDKDDLYLKWIEGNNAHYEAKNSKGEWVTVTQTAADDLAPYQAFYAVWERNAFYIYHSSTGKLQAVDMASVDGTYDLTAQKASGTLYGGWFNACGAVTEQNIETAKGAALADTNLQADVADAVIYDGTSLKNGDARFWLKDKIEGNTKGSAITPEKDKVYYLKEVPSCYLGTYVRWVYDKSKNNKIESIYFLTGIDEYMYKDVGFYVISTKEVGKVVSSFSYQVRYTDTITKITAASLIGQRGYLSVVDATKYISDIKSATEEDGVIIQPFWTTIDGEEVRTSGFTLFCSGEGELTDNNIDHTVN